MPGSLILISGAFSAGKTTLAHALRDALPVPFLHFSLDFLLFGDAVLPRTPDGTLRDRA
jgi:chloramphenicol 3-O phosphotransferase